MKTLADRYLPPRYQASLRRAYRRLNRVRGKMLRALPYDSTNFGPPRAHVATLKQLVSARPHEGMFREIYPAHVVERAEPVTDSPPIRPEFRRQLTARVPAAGVAVLRGARVVGRHGQVVSSRDELVWDASPQYERDGFETALARQLRLPPLRAMDGRLGNAGAWASDSYSHWLFDVLPKFHLLARSGIPVPRVAVEHRISFQRQTLELLGYPAELVPLDASTHLRPEQLIVPAMSIWPRHFPAWACRFLRDTFLPGTAQPDSGVSRLFVSRPSGGRMIANEADLLGPLAAAGFSMIRPHELSFREQVAAFASAEIVVATHGAGLANMVFCQPGTRIIEIFQPTFVKVVFWALANQLGLRYRYLMGEPSTEGTEFRSWSYTNIKVDERRLMTAIEADLAVDAGGEPALDPQV